MNIYRTASVAGLVILHSACGPLEDAYIVDNLEVDLCAHQKGNVLLPLAIGNYWTYRDSVHMQVDGQPGLVVGAGSSTTEIARMLRLDTGDEEICVGEQVKSANGEFDLVDYSWNGPDGLYFFQADSIAEGDSITWVSGGLSFKYPAELDDWWYTGNWKGHLVKTDVEKTTPAGTFDCLVYYVNLGTNHSYLHRFLYYTPGVGLIASEAYYDMDAIVYYEYDDRQASELWVESILIEYNLE